MTIAHHRQESASTDLNRLDKQDALVYLANLGLLGYRLLIIQLIKLALFMKKEII